jgi:hypothetical protein
MSYGAIERAKGSRGLCQACRDRKARFRFRGEVRADRDHTLCFECFRSQRDSTRAAALGDLPRPAPLRSPLPVARSLTAQQIEHRQRMLANLQRLSCGAGA